MKIAIIDDYLRNALTAADWSAVQARGEIKVFDRPLTLVDEAVAELADFDIICTLRERMPIPGTLITRLPRLKYIVVTGMRYDTVDIVTAGRLGIPVSNTSTGGIGGGGAVAELAWGLIFSLVRQIHVESHLMVYGQWQHHLGTTLKGKTLGVVGLGSIGTFMAEIGKAFGMDVLAWSPNLTEERARAAGVKLASKEELFQKSDVITLQLALSERSRNVVGRDELALMKKSAFIVNTARAGLMDEDALIEVLEAGNIAGAGLDVFSVEPLPQDHRLRRLPNVVLTPHLGYFTKEQLSAYYSEAIARILAFMDGRPMAVVNEQHLAERD